MTRQSIRTELLLAALEVLTAGGDVDAMDAAVERRAAELERTMKEDYAMLEKRVLLMMGERLQ